MMAKFEIPFHHMVDQFPHDDTVIVVGHRYPDILHLRAAQNWHATFVQEP